MWPDRVSNPGPPTYESGALPIALRGSIFDFECKILDQNATINGRDIINTRVKV